MSVMSRVLRRWQPGGLEADAGPSSREFSPLPKDSSHLLAANDHHFGDSFDAKAEHRAPASKHPMSRKQVELAAAAAVSNFKAPELLDDTTSFFDEPADLGPPTKPKQASLLCALESDGVAQVNLRERIC